MKKYQVTFRHRIIQDKLVEVMANSEEEAIEKAENCEFDDETITNEDGEETFDYEAEEIEDDEEGEEE